MKRKKDLSLEEPDLWEEAPEQKLVTVKAELSAEVENLLAELAPFGVRYHPDVPCKRCGCPLSYSLKDAPDCVVCCICLPGGHKYGYDRQARLQILFPGRAILGRGRSRNSWD